MIDASKKPRPRAPRFEWLDSLVRDPARTAMEIRVAWRIFDRLNSKNECWPSQELIARELGLFKKRVDTKGNPIPETRPVRRAVAGLVAAGWLNATPGGGRGKSTLYRIITETRTPVSSFNAGHKATVRNKKTRTPVSKNPDNPILKTRTILSSEPLKEPPKEPPQASRADARACLQAKKKIEKIAANTAATLRQHKPEPQSVDPYSQLRERAQRLIGERDGLIALMNLDADRLDALTRLEGAGDLDDDAVLAELKP